MQRDLTLMRTQRSNTISLNQKECSVLSRKHVGERARD